MQLIKLYFQANVSAVAGPTYTTAPNPVSTLTKSQILQILQLHRNYLRLAGIFGASAVILGAYGAHSMIFFYFFPSNCVEYGSLLIVFI